MAKNATDIIRKAIEEARDDWVNYTITQEHKIYTLLDDAANYITAQIARYTKDGKIPPARLKLLLNNIKMEMDRFRPRYKRLINKSKSVDYGIISSMQGAKVAMPSKFKIGIGTSFFGKDGKVRRYDSKIETYSDSIWAQINGQAMDALIRTSYGGIAFSRRVWDITWSAERQIRNQINLAVLTGQSSAKVSRRIRGYMGIPDTFRGLAFKEYHPGAGIYRSAYKNALRLANTEMSRAYVEGTFRYAMMKDWVIGWKWRTGSGNPCDDCLDNEGTFFSKKDGPPNIPLHPFCACYPETIYKGE